MSKFDFFEEGVRRVFDNYEIPASDNAWSDFQSKMGSGASSGSFLKHFILPGLIVGGILGTMNLSTTNGHVAHNNEDALEESTNITLNESKTQENQTENVQLDLSSLEEKSQSTEESNSETSISEKKFIHKEKSSEKELSNGSSRDNKATLAKGGDFGKRSYESEIESMKTKETIQYKGTAYKLGAPSKFTPNNDNRGDYFMPSELNAESNFVLEIVDSNKNLVFKSKSVKNKWGGTILETGKKADQGDYNWRVLKISDDKQEIFQGKVKLVR